MNVSKILACSKKLSVEETKTAAGIRFMVSHIDMPLRIWINEVRSLIPGPTIVVFLMDYKAFMTVSLQILFSRSLKFVTI
jgi:hypothetical protein